LSLLGGWIVITIHLRNAFDEIWRAEILERHRSHQRLKELVAYWGAKLGPKAILWAGKNEVEGDEGLQQGMPSSST
jgi:hypothetical protein